MPKSLENKTFGEAWRLYPDTVLVGVLHPGGGVELGPSDSSVLHKGDSLLMLAKVRRVETHGLPPYLRHIRNLKSVYRINTGKSICPTPWRGRHGMSSP